jgi:hypothetical protein
MTNLEEKIYWQDRSLRATGYLSWVLMCLGVMSRDHRNAKLFAYRKRIGIDT